MTHLKNDGPVDAAVVAILRLIDEHPGRSQNSCSGNPAQQRKLRSLVAKGFVARLNGRFGGITLTTSGKELLDLLNTAVTMLDLEKDVDAWCQKLESFGEHKMQYYSAYSTQTKQKRWESKFKSEEVKKHEL